MTQLEKTDRMDQLQYEEKHIQNVHQQTTNIQRYILFTSAVIILVIIIIFIIVYEIQSA